MEIFGILILLLLTGAVAGITAGLFGNGGGFAVVPALVFVFSAFENTANNLIFLAIGTSLGCIIFSSARAVASHSKRGAVDFDILKSWTPWLLFGVGFGLWIASDAEVRDIYLIFAAGVFFYGLYFSFPQLVNQLSNKKCSMPSGLTKVALVSFLGGFSALLGIAGGTITVITMSICRRPIYQAVATASGVGLIIGLGGSIGFLILGLNKSNLPYGSIGYVNLPALILISLMSVLTAPVGVRWAHNLEEEKLKKIFGAYLFFVSAGMFWKSNYTFV